MPQFESDMLIALKDYDIVIANPARCLPFAMFCNTPDAMKFLEHLKEIHPETEWHHMTLKDWFNILTKEA